MIRYDKHKLKNGIKTQVRVVEGYRDKDSKMKQRTIKNFGYLEDHVNNPTFIEQVTKFNEEYFKVKKDNKVLDINIFSDAIRKHWNVENKLYWQMDFTFKSDDNTTMNKKALFNLQIINK